MADKKFNPSEIEQKYQKIWEENKIFSPNLKEAKNPYYNLMMFPYPSAEGLHAGNMYAFTGADIWGRYQRMQGKDVFQPIGLDGFGIHSENYAIKIGEHPKDVSQKTQERFYAQLHSIGNAFAWDHKLETYDPDYYRWTQWLFVQMFKHGLAYRAKQAVNWCPSCLTVLADEQVIAGACERCGSQVEKRDLEQWFFKITDYAERLLGGLENLPAGRQGIDWSEKVKIAQRNWIGKKIGIEISYEVEGVGTTVEVFTTRPDTNFGATFIVLAPEHKFALELATDEQKKAVEEYIKKARSQTSQERIVEGREKTGVFTGRYAVNNLNGRKMPVWVSDFVLADFGTGAVVGVPGHDKRDFEFAKKFDLPIIRVVVGLDQDTSEITRIEQVQEEEGTMINSGFLDGLDIHAATQQIMDYLEEKGWGQKKTTYHLRDWLISRQRYWGPPIPTVFCKKCKDEGRSWFDTDEAKTMGNPKSEIRNPKNGKWKLKIGNSSHEMAGWYPVPEDQLPVVVPYVENYRPTGTGKSPLASDTEWVNVKCPSCGAEARRETDVSDTFLDSAWYFLRYLVTDREDIPFPSKAFENGLAEVGKRWLPVNMYIGGAEHSVLHLMYSRFVTMAFADWGLIDFDEPFTRFYAHGLLIREGKKMSKSKGNVIVPDEYIEKYGADTLRTYLMFLAPFDQGGDFRDTGIEGMSRFLSRVWTLVQKSIINNQLPITNEGKKRMHQAIKKVTGEIGELRYNTAIAGLMEYYNYLSKQEKVSLEEARVFVLMLAPFAPHLMEELWQNMIHTDKSADIRGSNQRKSKTFKSIHLEQWPTHNEALVVESIVEIPVQINGKLKGVVQVQVQDAENQEKVERQAREKDTTSKHLEGLIAKKVIFVPGKLINFVV